MTTKLLAQAGAQVLIESPEERQRIIERLQYLLKIKYPHIKWPALQEKIINLICQDKKIKRYQVISSSSMSSDNQIKWREILGDENIVDYKEDPHILGGFVIKKDHCVLDLSIQGRIDKVKQALTS